MERRSVGRGGKPNREGWVRLGGAGYSGARGFVTGNNFRFVETPVAVECLDGNTPVSVFTSS